MGILFPQNRPHHAEQTPNHRVRDVKQAGKSAPAQSAPRLDEAVIRAALPSREEVAARKGAPIESLRPEITVTNSFVKGTLGHYVDTQLAGKLENGNQIAGHMELLLRGAVYNKDATVEERAIDREAARAFAQHIADHHFDDPEEAKQFMDTINRFAENDILREKGYVVLENANITLYPTRTMPGAPDAYVRVDYEALRSVLVSDKTPAEKEAALDTLRSDTLRTFAEKEKRVGETVEGIKKALASLSVDRGFASKLDALFSLSPTQAERWDRIVKLLDPAQTRADAPQGNEAPPATFEYGSVAAFKAALRLSGNPTEDELARRAAYRESMRGAEMTMQGRAIDPDRLAEDKARAAKYVPIQNKIMSGQTLTAQEKNFLREHYPEAYGKAMQAENEAAALRRRLESAPSKEDAQRLYTEALLQALGTDRDSVNPATIAALERAYRKG